MKNLILVMVMVILAAGGCGKKTVINPGKGLPEKKYLVGGGFDIDYMVPSDGTVCVADKRYKQMILTKSVRQGERFVFNVPSERRGYYEKYQLYFMPGGTPVGKVQKESPPSVTSNPKGY